MHYLNSGLSVFHVFHGKLITLFISCDVVVRDYPMNEDGIALAFFGDLALVCGDKFLFGSCNVFKREPLV